MLAYALSRWKLHNMLAILAHSVARSAIDILRKVPSTYALSRTP